MTEEQIKERLSRHFVELIASRAGFKAGKPPDPDSGVDIEVTRAVPREEPNGRVRFLDTGEYIQLQLKCTCERQVRWHNDRLAYDLAVKTYNDLVTRQRSGAIVPLVLVLFVLPDEPEAWLTISSEEITLRRAAYWYRPPASAQPSANENTVAIHIDLAQTVNLTFVPSLFAEVYP